MWRVQINPTCRRDDSDCCLLSQMRHDRDPIRRQSGIMEGPTSVRVFLNRYVAAEGIIPFKPSDIAFLQALNGEEQLSYRSALATDRAVTLH